jgi:hypothetical protein
MYQDSQNFQGYTENLTEYIPNHFENNNNDNIVTTYSNFFNDSLHKNEPTASVPLTHSVTPNFQSTSRMISQNIPFMYQKFQGISNSIMILEENAKRQLEQVYELKDHLNQLKQFLNAHRQHPMPRRVNRNRDYRTHPYLNERHLVSSRTLTTAEPDHNYDNNELGFMNRRNILSSSFRPQQVNVPDTVSYSENNEILSASPQNFEFYNVQEI